MAKAYNPKDLASRAFLITLVGVGTFIACVFLFIL